MVYKGFFGAVAIALTFAAFLPYIWGIKAGRTRPHVFSWVIWGAVTLVVFLAQLADGGGAGAWPTGVSSCITLYIALLAYLHKSDTTIARVDWFFLLAAVMSLPLWYITANPLSAVIVLTTVDALGFGPTIRKAYLLPFEEHPGFFSTMAVRNVFSIIALEHYSLTTLLFPAVTALFCLSFTAVVFWRRRSSQKIHHVDK